MKKLILFLFFVFIIPAVYAVPGFPIQIYGEIIPALPQEYDMSFEIDNVVYETGIAEDMYGVNPPKLVKIPIDDLASPSKEGYNSGDTVMVYINDVFVTEHDYDDYLDDTTPVKIDIYLTDQQYEDIVGEEEEDDEEEEDECTRSRCTSNDCQSRTACIGAGCSWTGSKCLFPGGGGGGNSGTSGLPAGGCFNNYVYTDWGECSPEGLQSRIKSDIGTCQEPDEIEYRQCTYVPPYTQPEPPTEEPTIEEEKEEPEEKGFPWIWVILAVVIVGGFGIVFYEIEKSRKHLDREKTTHHKEVHPNTYANLEGYIRNTIKMGYSRPQIRQRLTQEGWSAQILNNVFSRIK